MNFDDTTVRAGGKRHWVHSASTTALTLHRIHIKRGCEALNARGVLPGYPGVAGPRRVHLVPELSGSRCALRCTPASRPGRRRRGDSGALGEATQALLREGHAAAQQARQQGVAWVDAEALRARYNVLLLDGHATHPYKPPSRPKVRGRQSAGYNLALRLERHADAVLAFLDDTRVPFDNNLAERDLRMLKTQQKITGGFRTVHGAEVFCRIRSYVSTLRKQHLPLLNALRCVFSRDPRLPAFAG